MNRRFPLLVALLLLAGPAVSACSGSAPKAAQGPGCGDCAGEMGDVRAEIESLPWVKKVFVVDRYASSPTNGAGVDVQVRSRTVGKEQQADELARIVWQSKVQPLDVVDVTVEGSDGELVSTLPYDFRESGRNYESYVEEWGERPLGAR